MPTYEYRCKACGHEFEEFQSMSEDPLVKCPKCGKKKLVRVISGAGLVFKGSGFYLTDYKKREDASSGAPSESKPAASEGETKPAATKEKAKGEKRPSGGDKPSSGGGKSSSGGEKSSSGPTPDKA